MSARGFTRLLKVARSIADLELADEVKKHHLEEALSFRKL
jgi:magnesium chelatase family protein